VRTIYNDPDPNVKSHAHQTGGVVNESRVVTEVTDPDKSYKRRLLALLVLALVAVLLARFGIDIESFGRLLPVLPWVGK